MPKHPVLHKHLTPRRAGQRPSMWLTTATIASLVLLSMASRVSVNAWPTPVDGGAHELVPQTASTYEIAGNQVVSFEIALRRGQRLLVELVKGDMKVAVATFGPGAQTRGEFASTSYEPLVVSLIAEADGVHRLEVRSLEAEADSRRFTLKVEG